MKKNKYDIFLFPKTDNNKTKFLFFKNEDSFSEIEVLSFHNTHVIEEANNSKANSCLQKDLKNIILKYIEASENHEYDTDFFNPAIKNLIGSTLDEKDQDLELTFQPNMFKCCQKVSTIRLGSGMYLGSINL
tara:strand:- start:12450 stop:12845 length:396 start_codon:yes stop_codon:yes gene_type:complete